MVLSDEERSRRVIPSPEKLSDEERSRLGLDLGDPEPGRPQLMDAYVVVSPTLKGGSLEKRDARGRPLMPTSAEKRWQEWDLRRRLRVELHATAAAREASLSAAEGLRAKVLSLRERAAAQEAAGQPAHARVTSGEANRVEVAAERREGRAEQERDEIRRLQAELRAAGASKVGSWLRRRLEVSDAVPADDPSASVH